MKKKIEKKNIRENRLLDSFSLSSLLLNKSFNIYEMLNNIRAETQL